MAYSELICRSTRSLANIAVERKEQHRSRNHCSIQRADLQEQRAFPETCALLLLVWMPQTVVVHTGCGCLKLPQHNLRAIHRPDTAHLSED